jgi:predicted phosphodiesterase
MEFDVKIPTPKSPVGIIADSHGLSEKIHVALEFLADRGCGYLIHLGDICDSTRPQTAEACVRPLHKFAVDAIKGNNDHQIVVNHDGQRSSLIAPDVLDFLKKLPLVREYQNAVFTHSLPFARELGLSSMVGDLGNLQLHQFFRTYPQGLLFRGHSHSPHVHFEKDHQVISRKLYANQKVDLMDRLPCVVTCGALTRGFCMVWTPGQHMIECQQFE